MIFDRIISVTKIMREFSLIWRYSVLISISCFGYLLRVEFAQFLLVQITMELEVVDVTKKRLKYSVCPLSFKAF